MLDTGGGARQFVDDARAFALIAVHHKGLHQGRRDGQPRTPELLSEGRDGLVRDRRRVPNRLHQLLRELIAGGVPAGLNPAQAAAAL